MFQVSFVKLNEIFNNYLLINALLKPLLTQRALNLYQELLKVSIEEGERVVDMTTKNLLSRTGYSRETIRHALRELQDAKLITKHMVMKEVPILFVEMKYDFFAKNLKGKI